MKTVAVGPRAAHGLAAAMGRMRNLPPLHCAPHAHLTIGRTEVHHAAPGTPTGCLDDLSPANEVSPCAITRILPGETLPCMAWPRLQSSPIIDFTPDYEMDLATPPKKEDPWHAAVVYKCVDNTMK